MLVSHRKQFIYLKTVKTAGTSVESYFEPYCMLDGEWQQTHTREEYSSSAGIIGYRGLHSKGKTYFNHISAAGLKALLPEAIWQQYFKFAVIRDPFDKQVSAFYFFSKMKGIELSHDSKELVKQFRAWLSQTKGIYDGDKYLIESKFILDGYIKYETLQQDLIKVGDLLDIPYEEARLPRFKSEFRPVARQHFAEFYDQPTVDIVRQRYEFELEKFGYALPDLT